MAVKNKWLFILRWHSMGGSFTLLVHEAVKELVQHTGKRGVYAGG